MYLITSYIFTQITNFKLFIICLFIFSCVNNSKKETIDTTFEKSEINHLIEYFESIINKNDIDKNVAYSNFLKHLSDLNHPSLHCQKLNHNLFKKKTKDFINSNFSIEKNKDYTYITINKNSNLFKYLNQTSRLDNRYNWYYKKTVKTGDIPQLFELQSLFIKTNKQTEEVSVQKDFTRNEKFLIVITYYKHIYQYCILNN